MASLYMPGVSLAVIRMAQREGAATTVSVAALPTSRGEGSLPYEGLALVNEHRHETGLRRSEARYRPRSP